MHPDTREVAEHMREFGMAILGRAAYDLTFSEHTQPWKHAMAVGHAAHGAEIILKARIAQEHPLLLFSQLPKSTNAPDQLTIAELFQYGKTIQFSELPEVLWATTGIRIGQVQQFHEFGKLRNRIIHFAVPSVDYQKTTFKFLFEVMEPLVRSFWNETVIVHAGIWDDYLWEDDGLRGQLKRAGVKLTPEIKWALDHDNYDNHGEGPLRAMPPAGNKKAKKPSLPPAKVSAEA